jgi:threonine/homoserine/homoserine lactone efflux protein
MTLQQTATIALAFAVAMASPGPGVMAVVSRALAFGWRGNLGFILGMVIGDLIFIVLAVSGLAALAHAFAPVFETIKYLGAAYLVWLGIKTWRAARLPVEVAAAPPGQAQGLVGGLVLTLANPKTMVFYLALFPAVADLPALVVRDVAVLMVIAAIILSSVMLGYSLAAARVRALLRSPRALGNLNRGVAVVMVGVGIAVAARSNT